MKQNEKIKIIRRYKGLTQKEVAEKMGTTAQNYSQYETGKRTPTRSTLEKIAAAIGCDPLEISADITTDGLPFDTPDGMRQKTFINNFLSLNQEGQKKALDFLDVLLMVPEYQNDIYKAKKVDFDTSFLYKLMEGREENSEFVQTAKKIIQARNE